ncbi:MAG: DUF3427 domain-containing protein [Opitutales bacterium]
MPADSESEPLAPGVYERLIDAALKETLAAHPELGKAVASLDDEARADHYSRFVQMAVQAALRTTQNAGNARDLVNRLLELLGATEGADYLKRRKLLGDKRELLTEVRTDPAAPSLPRPASPLSISSLMTGSGDDPPLEHELRAEIASADRIDILVSFIKWSGLRLLKPAIEAASQRGTVIRVVTTSYMGASDPAAVEWLAAQPGVTVRVSYDTERTRLHAKAWHFHRASGYATAYIGSANMSHSAMTSGLEWTVKVTAQDMPHVLDRFKAEFETYWCSDAFAAFDPNGTEDPQRFRRAIQRAQNTDTDTGGFFFAEITPRPFQERILEALTAERDAGRNRNLIVAATGTGKTVVAAFDYARNRLQLPTPARLLFVAHRREILEQARACFRQVLRDPNFGELLVSDETPVDGHHVFASVQTLARRRIWEHLGGDYFGMVIVDEVHHAPANSYRPVLDHLEPQILLGLTATPERMDGASLLPDFGDTFAADIRLPEALEEKLLCPFHYFGVSDVVDVSEERFWRQGKYDVQALEAAYTGDDIRARQRLDLILAKIQEYCPIIEAIRCVGFCVSQTHARYMADAFEQAGLTAAVILGDTSNEVRAARLRAFRRGELQYLFTVDVFSEGIDLPGINLVLFLRPTESLTVFLQQLGRGLRHAPEKDCLTVLDFVGQVHRKYRIDRKFAALIRKKRRRIDREIEADFPNLPPGCNIQLERVARQHVLRNIQANLGNLQTFIPEAIQTFEGETGKSLTFGNFIRETGLSPLEVLGKRTWSGWKARAFNQPFADASAVTDARKALRRLTLRTDPELLRKAELLAADQAAEDPAAYGLSDAEAGALHYLLWGRDGAKVGVDSYAESFRKWCAQSGAADDLREVAAWRRSQRSWRTPCLDLPGAPGFHLHAAYGAREITAAYGKATLETSGPTGLGVIPIEDHRTYIHLITFRKEDRDFAPTTRYRDYPIRPDVLHWESQSTTNQQSKTGQNYIQFRERGYTILFFARLERRTRNEPEPFLCLGPAKALLEYTGNRPIQMTWHLQCPMPAALFEEAKAV